MGYAVKCKVCKTNDAMIGNSMCAICWQVQFQMSGMSIPTIRALMEIANPVACNRYLSQLEMKVSQIASSMQHKSRQCGSISPTVLGAYADELIAALKEYDQP